MIDRIQNCKCAVRLFAAADDLAMITYNFSQFFTPMRRELSGMKVKRECQRHKRDGKGGRGGSGDGPGEGANRDIKGVPNKGTVREEMTVFVNTLAAKATGEIANVFGLKPDRLLA